MAAQAFATLGEWDVLQELHETIQHYVKEGFLLVIGTLVPFHALLAVTSRAVGKPDEAEKHFAEAHRLAGELLQCPARRNFHGLGPWMAQVDADRVIGQIDHDPAFAVRAAPEADVA